MSTSVVLLAYKEAENLRILLPQIKKNLEEIQEEYEILVIDTETPLDDTESVCKEFGAKYIPQEKPFYAGAFQTGIKYASKEKMLILDADGSHNPKDIKAIQKKYATDNCDIVIGSRYTAGGKTNDSVSSILMSKLLNTVMRICIGVKAQDISTSYRLYDTAQIKKVCLTRNNYDVLQEVILRMKINNKNLKIGEVPIEFNKRMFGESKRQLFKFVCGYLVSVVNFTFIRMGIKQ